LLIQSSTAYSSTALTPVAAFGLYTILSKYSGYTPLGTEKVFTSLALIQLLLTPVSVLIETLAGVMSAVGSFERIREYVTSATRQDQRKQKGETDMGDISFPATAVRKSLIRNSYVYELVKLKPPPEYGRIRPSCIVLKNACGGWEEDKWAFSDINTEIRRSELTMIIGPVGSGKSTLLNAILGETPYGSGTVQVDFAEAAYCSQQPWLTNGTVRQNIIGASDFDKRWYSKVLTACGLDTDIQHLPLADHSMIGSKGTVLSGGQQMRVVSYITLPNP
jgi:ATP-binding cassette subfamily C (CFTR/MRP) protein 1